MAGKQGTRPKDTYEITVEGYLDRKWEAWFDGLAIDHRDDESTTLKGTLPDQTALHSILNRIRDMNLTLRSVQHIEKTEEEA